MPHDVYATWAACDVADHSSRAFPAAASECASLLSSFAALDSKHAAHIHGINMTGQTQRALWLCFMHAAATFYIAHIFFINCKFRSDPRGIHELAVCSVPCPGTVGERGTAALMLQQLRLEGSVAVPSGQRTRSRR